MDSILDRTAKMAGTQLNKMRWALGLNGVLSIAFGVVILVWPGISLYALTILFGAYATATGIVGLGTAFSGAAAGERAWLVIGAYAVALGIIAVAGAFWLPIDGGDTALLILTGLISILFGIVIFARPGAGALVVLALIAAFALINGISELVVAIGGKRLLESGVTRLVAAKPQTSTT